MDLRQLECFVAVAEELHFGRAAERLCMTQPPLSRQIKLLENELEVELFSRAQRQIRLTVAGRCLLDEARRLIAGARKARVTTRRAAAGELGVVNFGYTTASAYRLMPELLAKAARVLPEVAVDLHEDISVHLVERLRDGLLDLALVRRIPADSALEFRRVEREPMMAALPAGHVLAGQSALALTAFNRQPFVMYAAQEGKYFHDLIEKMLAKHGVAPRYVHFVSQTQSLLGIVRAGLGLGIVPASARELCLPGIEFRPLKVRGVHADMYAAWRRQHQNPALSAFLEKVLGRPSARRTPWT
ncbi:hypothetical protein CAL29_02090 [Bordetella genomosp. 10]|uniref:HTH lysR-type domain-containing protein n=1 Tax=Bordetella genomosp. 10 TaxID=1416804 RepID=A0A261SJN3_9BORD|nr:LysR family transcriptional regulator [Bordetella genomosp. 10]OZI37241.1 hypothetical protein CAL29_02090 [Bordetella genomosp. 10]